MPEKMIDPAFASLKDLQLLPAFARFLLAEKLDEYCRLQLLTSYELEIPVLKFFAAMPENQFLALIKESTTEYLTRLADNDAEAFIASSIDRWQKNHLPMIDRNAVVAEDITLTHYMRKKLLMHFLPSFTQDSLQILKLVGEIDLFLVQYLNIATNTYIDLLKTGLDEQLHFIQKVNETIPGAIYVYDSMNIKESIPTKAAAVIGYGQEELNAIGENAVAQLIHPADQDDLIAQRQSLQTAKDGETFLCKYRVKNKDGNYTWLASYDAVFNGTIRARFGKLSVLPSI
jgi:PAS domain-containing protein